MRRLAGRAGITLHEDRGSGTDRQWRTELLDAMERAVGLVPRATALGPRRRAGPRLPALARLRRRGRAPVPAGLGARRLGRASPGPRALRAGADRHGPRIRQPARPPPGRVPRPHHLPDLRPVGPAGGPRGPDPAAPPGVRARPGRGPEPKYKNSQETAIYSKRRTLYGLNWAKQDVVATGEVVVCEGYTDVIGFFQAGVAARGRHLRDRARRGALPLLRNFGQADRARLRRRHAPGRPRPRGSTSGSAATRSTWRWPRSRRGPTRASWPPRDPKRCAEAVATSRPFLQFRLDRVLQGADLSTAEGRAKAADAAIEVIAEHPDDLVRDQYAMVVGLLPARARSGAAPPRGGPAPSGPTARGGRRPRPQAPEGGDATVPEPTRRSRPGRRGRGGPTPRRARRIRRSRPGLEALRLAVHRPEEVADRIEDVLFGDELQRRAFLALVEADSLHDAIDGAPPDVADLLRRVAVEEPVIADGHRRSGRRRGHPARAGRQPAALADLQVRARTQPDELARLAAETARVRLWLEQLDDPSAGSEAADRLLAWLLEQGAGGLMAGRQPPYRENGSSRPDHGSPTASVVPLARSSELPAGVSSEDFEALFAVGRRQAR